MGKARTGPAPGLPVNAAPTDLGSARTRRTLGRFRPPTQAICLLLFIALAVWAAWPGSLPFRATAWLIADPLVALVGTVSAKTTWLLALWALILVAATMLVGRFFCGWMCPVGTVLDFTDPYLRRRKTPRLGEPLPGDEIRPRAKWKHYVLAVIVAGAVFGVSTGLAFDPLVMFARTVELIFVPMAAWTGYEGIHALRGLPGQSSLTIASWETPPLYAEMTVTALIFLGIIALGRIERRFWCRNLCPLGALLGWLGRTGLIKRYVNAECADCTRCERNCPMGAIPNDDFTKTHRGECIQCLRCQEVCLKAETRFGLKGRHEGPGFVPQRRQALAAIGAGLGVGLLGASSSRAAPRPSHVIRPPGAIPEAEFLSRCTRCLACVEACPTNGLQPMGTEAGWAAIWSPILKPMIGGCEEPCFKCTQVCPTEAIRTLTHEEKSFAKIGTARIWRERCLAWEQLKPCLVCDEVCPYDAVDFLTITDHRGTQRRPVVRVEKCIGCGICEYACPVHEPRAIVVEFYGEQRLRTGSYITPKKRRMRKVGDDRDVDYLKEYRGFDSAVPQDSRPSSPEKEEPLPPGFIVE